LLCATSTCPAVADLEAMSGLKQSPAAGVPLQRVHLHPGPLDLAWVGHWEGNDVGLDFGDDFGDLFGDSPRGEFAKAEIPGWIPVPMSQETSNPPFQAGTDSARSLKQGDFLRCADGQEARHVVQSSELAECVGNGCGKDRPISDNWPANATSVMLRNIPNRYTSEELLAELLCRGFDTQCFNFLYMPMDFSTKRNRGYGFINFTTVDIAVRFVATFHGLPLGRYESKKVLEITPAKRQGFKANVVAYLRKDGRVENPWFRPMIFDAHGASSLVGTCGSVE